MRFITKMQVKDLNGKSVFEDSAPFRNNEEGNENEARDLSSLP